MSKEKPSPLVVRVVGTSPLSFELRPGAVLSVKEIGPSSHIRPTAGGGKFKSSAYLLFNGITKIGRLSPASLAKIGENVPSTCKVVQVDKQKKVLSVEFDQSGK